MSEKYSIQPVTDSEKWDNFVEKSSQGTNFSKYGYLNSCGRKFENQFVLKGNEIKAGYSVILSDDGREVELDDLVIYNGIFFVPDDPNQKKTSIYTDQFRITEFIIQELTKKYKKLEMSLFPTFKDIRPFLWYNYHSENTKEKFNVSIRYTSLINIEDLQQDAFEENIASFKNLDVVRQRNIRKARKENAFLKEENKTDLFIEYYKKNLQFQNINPSDEKLTRMKFLIEEILKNKNARSFVAYNGRGEVGTIHIFNFDSKRAYYLFGASNPEITEQYCGTIAFWDSFKILARSGIKEIDMEGINSPQRGWFKLSFGGDIKPYYEVSYGL